MVDECSVVNNCHWDATSITSDGTTANELFHTPAASMLDVCNPEKFHDDCHSLRSFTPKIQDIKLMEYNAQQEIESGSIKLENENMRIMENESLKQDSTKVPKRPPPMVRQQAVVSSVNESESLSKKRSWKQEFMRKMSFTRSRIMKSFSIPKINGESKSSGNIFKSMRLSIIRMRSFDKRSKSSRNGEKTTSESVSAVIGSDCEYFNFERDLNSPDAMLKTDQISLEEREDEENTPLKPRRIFKQEKYLTGSKDILQKAYNSLKRKSHLEDNKSLLDIYSTVSHLFMAKPVANDFKNEINFHKLMNGCVNSFIDVHTNQIEKSLKLINEIIFEDIDLYSQDLDMINKSKKYKITEIYGSKGICIITNVNNKKQFVALKRSGLRSWIIFNGFLQHIEKCDILFPNQEWICFPAQSIKNLFVEKNLFNYNPDECRLLLRTLIQIIVILYCQMMNNFNLKMNPSKILLITSDLSIIFVFIESIEQSEDESDSIDWLNCNENNEKETIDIYHNLLMELNKYVEKFLHSPENSSHLISASYPLDYLFFLLLKLNKNISVILNKV